VTETSQSDTRLWTVVEYFHIAVHSALQSVPYTHSPTVSIAKRDMSACDVPVLPHGYPDHSLPSQHNKSCSTSTIFSHLLLSFNNIQPPLTCVTARPTWLTQPQGNRRHPHHVPGNHAHVTLR
jgi:hypothetical protein